ncbi:hypothetical protein ACFO1B_55420 [Dactylosporangium siamense]|uniref:hypothetical protein n=1 Tax=Dactylosporangium siamense TaxID=685454 RepID=UPI0019434A66|nr:hypothetical protein [Dactylosporangium siamense]
MFPDPDPPVKPADCAALAERLVTLPFPPAATAADDWIIGRATSGPDRHFAPIAASEVLEDAPAERWTKAQDRLERRLLEVVQSLTAAWGPSQIHSFAPDFDRIIAGQAVRPVVEDITLFAYGHHANVWHRSGRTVCVVLGQLDKHYPIVLMIAVTAEPLGDGFADFRSRDDRTE